MNRYWDLSARERSELTEEMVQACLTVELMEKGVTKVSKPELMPVAEVEKPETILYVPKCDYSEAPFGFRNAEDAARLMLEAVPIKSEYISGTSQKCVGKGDTKIEVIAIAVYSQEHLSQQRLALEKNNAASAENQKRLNAYNAAQKQADDATKGVWKDWYDCLSAAADNKRIVDTFNEYVETCDGNERLAFTFLGKAYDPADIRDAFAWFGMEQPGTTEAVEADEPVRA